MDGYLEKEREQWGYEITDPKYQREYLGKWVKSGEMFILDIAPHNLIKLPQIPAGLIYVIGVDIGFQDAAAVVVVGYDRVAQKCYHVAHYADTQMGLTQIMAVTDRLIKEWQPEAVVVDPATGGANFVKDLQLRYDIPCLIAKKLDKAGHFRILRAGLKRGEVYIQSGSELQYQLQALEWSEDHKREKEGIPCDLADAFLYAFVKCYHWYKEEPPKVETAEDRILRAAREEWERKNSDEPSIDPDLFY